MDKFEEWLHKKYLDMYEDLNGDAETDIKDMMIVRSVYKRFKEEIKNMPELQIVGESLGMTKYVCPDCKNQVEYPSISEQSQLPRCINC